MLKMAKNMDYQAIAKEHGISRHLNYFWSTETQPPSKSVGTEIDQDSKCAVLSSSKKKNGWVRPLPNFMSTTIV